MAVKTKPKVKTIKKVSIKPARGVKASVSKSKKTKHIRLSASASKKVVKAHPKPSPNVARKSAGKSQPRLAVSRPAAAKAALSQKSRETEHASAIQAYESGLKLMHAEEYDKAVKVFEDLIGDFGDEPEIQERARVLMHASEKKRQEKNAAASLKSADDHYNMGIAELNGRELNAAIQHLQHALKLAPKGDHILYAMAAANALKGNRDEALTCLKQSIHHRPENRFLASRDSDFESLAEDADFKQLVTVSEK